MSRLKVYRLFCLLFSFILLLASFGVPVSASDTENLIDSDLREWNNLYPDTTSVFYRYRVASGVTYDAYGFTSKGVLVEGTDNNLKLKVSSLYSLKSLVSGKSYSFNFHLLDLEEANFITSGITEENYYGGLINGNGEYIIGLASFNSNIESFDMVEGAYIVINKDNYLDYYGKDNTISFVLPNIVNPCITITYYEASTRNYQQNIYLNNISLVDNDQVEEDGFFQKLFDWFEEKFDAIGNSFTELGNNILNGLKSLFVPSDDYFPGLKSRFDEMMSNSFGFVYDITKFFIRLMEKLRELLSNNSSDELSFTLPALQFEFLGYDIKLWDDITLSLSFINSIPGLNVLYGLYKISLHGICITLFMLYGKRVYEKAVE